MREYADLHALLPHRHPILLVDRVVAVEPGVRIETRKTVSGSEPCYAAAPGGYGYPPTLLLESFVQSAALLWAISLRSAAGSNDSAGSNGTDRLDGPDGEWTLVLGAVRDAQFHTTAYPGDVVRHEVRLEQTVGSNAVLTGRSLVEGSAGTLLTVRSVVLSRRRALVAAGAR
jgi:3-hydroxyacyl-[acyl-carrier-protein] dehydratase